MAPAAGNERGRFDYFDRHREDLIGLVSPAEFTRMFGWPPGLAPMTELPLAEWRARQADPSEAWFDESYYLQANADVASSMSEGSLSSGYAHFMCFGANEGRSFRMTGRDEMFVLPEAARNVA